MVNIIAFEGSDYSGKTTISNKLVEKIKFNQKVRLNTGTIYMNNVTKQLEKISHNMNDLDKEFIYTMGFVYDKVIDDIYSSNELIIEDRYWPSVIAYGRFLNGKNSIHYENDLSNLFISPKAIIHLKCSIDEKINRSKIRTKKSKLDQYFLKSPNKIHDLEKEIDLSMKNIKNVFTIDTTNKSEEYVLNITCNYLNSIGLIK